MQQENQPDLFSDISFDETARQHLRSMASWAMVIVVIALIGYGLNIIQLVTSPTGTTRKSEGFDLGLKMGGNSSIAFDIIGILVGLLINFFLFRFATQSRNALKGLNQGELNSSFNNLKNYFMVISILCIIGILIFIGAIVLVSIGK
ncbi:MAG: hypothetical protein ABIR18_00285 [Chitinophagaceae bacterium]